MSRLAGKTPPTIAAEVTSPPLAAAAPKRPYQARALLRAQAKGLLLVAVLVLLGWGLERLTLGDGMNAATLDRYMRAHGLSGILWFTVMGALLTAVGFPRQVIGFFGGYVYGWLAGGGLATIATLLGASAAYAGARLLRGMLRVRQLPVAISFLRAQPFTTVLMVRLLPIGNNLVTNLVAGLFRVPFAAFISASALGYLPQSVIFALLGNGIEIGSTPRFGIGVVLFAVTSLLGVRLYRRGRHPPGRVQ